MLVRMLYTDWLKKKYLDRKYKYFSEQKGVVFFPQY